MIFLFLCDSLTFHRNFDNALVIRAKRQLKTWFSSIIFGVQFPSLDYVEFTLILWSSFLYPGSSNSFGLMNSVCPPPNEGPCHHFFWSIMRLQSFLTNHRHNYMMTEQCCVRFLCSWHNWFAQLQLLICHSVSLVVRWFLLCTWNFAWV